jgi:hypothetical protein
VNQLEVVDKKGKEEMEGTNRMDVIYWLIGRVIMVLSIATSMFIITEVVRYLLK